MAIIGFNPSGSPPSGYTQLRVLAYPRLYAWGPFAGVNGLVTALSIYIGAGIGSAKIALAVYLDNAGVPGTLLYSSGSITPTANAWNSINLSQTISAGNSYWLSVFTSTTTSSGTFYQLTGSGAVSEKLWTASAGFPTFDNPASLASPSTTLNVSPAVYATYTPASGKVPRLLLFQGAA